jgi:NAD(P)-dependent dehydrogenase (short-subunit alcohol dehydrogenase family)
VTQLDGAVVLVTGANGGLGREWVAQAINRGAEKVYATDISLAEWDSERIVPLRLDVTDQDSIEQAAKRAADTTVLINNAGIPLRDPITTVDSTLLRRAFDVDFFGQVSVTQQFAPLLGGNGGGAIVNVISAQSWIAVAGGYSVAKSALWATTNAFRVELHPQGTQVLALHMGYVDTPMTAMFDIPKISPFEVVQIAFDGLEDGAEEVLVDEVSRQVKAAPPDPLPRTWHPGPGSQVSARPRRHYRTPGRAEQRAVDHLPRSRGQ